MPNCTGVNPPGGSAFRNGERTSTVEAISEMALDCTGWESKACFVVVIAVVNDVFAVWGNLKAEVEGA